MHIFVLVLTVFDILIPGILNFYLENLGQDHGKVKKNEVYADKYISTHTSRERVDNDGKINYKADLPNNTKQFIDCMKHT